MPDASDDTDAGTSDESASRETDGSPDEETASGGSWAAYLTYRALGTVMQRLPELAAAAAAGIVALVVSAFPGKAGAMYGRNARRVVGVGTSDAEMAALTRRAFLNYARYWFEGARLPALGPEVVAGRMHVESGWEHLVAGMEAGKGVIMALPHIGSWEWGGAWLALQGYPMTSVAEPLKPPAMYDWFVAQREAMGLTIVPLGAQASGVLLRTLKAGKLVGLLCDRDIGGNGVDVELFGERTTMPAGPAMLALRTGAVLLPTAVYSGPGIEHTAVIMPPVPAERTGRLRQDVARVTQLIASDLEQLIRRAPEQWHLFQPNWPNDGAADSAR
ncbi:MAG TPA: phosphatidylinositol mannoside acyltransferase [Acidimicrobiales bacterium]|nr:phosphatidylinositol mannoside acyltransferase [Acidimicrobiales bacterium]